MRVVTYPLDLSVGGSQVTAIELTAEMQRLGHEVAVFGQPGPLAERVRELDLEFIESPPVRTRPTRAVVSSLRRELSRRGTEIVHGYEWPPTLEATLACRGTGAVPVSTVLSSPVAPFIPDYVPLLVGTEQSRAAELSLGRQHVGLMQPSVDTRMNSPHVCLPLHAFRRTWNLDPEAFTVVVVSRLVHGDRLEAVMTAIEAVGRLSRKHRVQLVVVGGGEALETVRERAQRVNAETTGTAIVVTGEMIDPRPAYAVADVALGMGRSAVRAMAFGTPVIVQGTGGYFQPLTVDTLPVFLQHGWGGHGPSPAGGFARLYALLTSLMKDPGQRRRRAEFSLWVAREHFSLTGAAERQLEFFERVRRAPARHRVRTASSDALAAKRYLRHEIRPGSSGGSAEAPSRSNTAG